MKKKTNICYAAASLTFLHDHSCCSLTLSSCPLALPLALSHNPKRKKQIIVFITLYVTFKLSLLKRKKNKCSGVEE